MESESITPQNQGYGIEAVGTLSVHVSEKGARILELVQRLFPPDIFLGRLLDECGLDFMERELEGAKVDVRKLREEIATIGRLSTSTSGTFPNESVARSG